MTSSGGTIITSPVPPPPPPGGVIIPGLLAVKEDNPQATSVAPRGLT